jgi:hypothetical protein
MPFYKRVRRWVLVFGYNIRGHFQTIFGKINVITTLEGRGIRAMMPTLA